jgi:molecular chaperone DnaJ
MPALKDYYRILEIAPDATAEDIKKAYRALAFKYHPDTTADIHHSFAGTHFLEIQEAYAVLGNEQKRRNYDEERWLSGMSKRARDTQVITPEWVWHEAKKLRQHMAGVDTYRMSHNALHDYVFLLLSDSHMAILQQTNEAASNQMIAQELLMSTRHLEYEYMKPVCDRIALLVPGDSVMLSAIYKQQQHSYRRSLWEKYMPALIAGVTLLLCVVMYFYSRKN